MNKANEARPAAKGNYEFRPGQRYRTENDKVPITNLFIKHNEIHLADCQVLSRWRIQPP
jgi:hypothetical protein